MSEIISLSEGYPYRGDKGCFGFGSILLVKGKHHNILFDVGNYSLRSEILPVVDSVDSVVISHLHFDHCSNLDLFANKDISIYISSLELAYYEQYKNIDFDLFSYFEGIKNKLSIISITEETELDDQVNLLFTSGHTRGDISLEVDRDCILAGDALKSYLDYCNLSFYGNAFSPNEYIETKKKIIEKYPIIYPGHDGVIIDGKVKRKMKVREF